MKIVVLVMLALVYGTRARLEVAFQWQYLNWEWPTVPLSGKKFVFGNPFTQDVDIDERGRVFVTSPPWLEGTPITLSTLTNKLNDDGGPLLTPYPDYTWHKPKCDKLVAVYRIAIDECNRLWAIDSGRVTGKAVCASKIVVFDLDTDRMIRSYVIPGDQAIYGNASLVTPIVEVGKTCEDTYLYIADVDKNGVVIYDYRQNYSWRLSNTKGNAFGPDDDAMNITIAGEFFDLDDGVLGMSLSPPGFFAERYLYFNSLASFHQKFTDVASLKRSQFWEPPIYESIYKRASQAGVQATSRYGVLFFQLVQLTAIACWNIERPFTPENVVMVAQDEEKLQYVSGIKVITNTEGREELWFNTNRLQKTINMTLTPTELNFRLIRGYVDEIIQGTNCEPLGYRRKAPELHSWRLT